MHVPADLQDERNRQPEWPVKTIRIESVAFGLPAQACIVVRAPPTDVALGSRSSANLERSILSSASAAGEQSSAPRTGRRKSRLKTRSDVLLSMIYVANRLSNAGLP